MAPIKKKDPIVQAEAPVLRQVAVPIEKAQFGSAKLKTLVKKMSTVLSKEAQGVALAAPQVGISLRLFIIAGRVFEQENSKENGLAERSEEIRGPFRKNSPAKIPDMVFINPEITRASRKSREMSEGCLSVRGKYGAVLRHEKVTVRAYDLSGKQFTYHGTDLIGHIFQHEIDHLDGIIYTDKATQLRDDTNE